MTQIKMFNNMTDRRRCLFLKVIKHPENINNDILFHLTHLNKMKHCDLILSWLINKGIIGQNLIEWARINNFGPITMSQYILRDIDHANKVKPIIVGEDFFK